MEWREHCVQLLFGPLAQGPRSEAFPQAVYAAEVFEPPSMPIPPGPLPGFERIAMGRAPAAPTPDPGVEYQLQLLAASSLTPQQQVGGR